VALLKKLQPHVLKKDLNQTLQFINQISECIDGALLISDSLKYLQETPQSFIANDLIVPTDDIEALRQNEFFARRWWELARLDYRKDI